MKSLTICFTTARKEPRFEWFRDSLFLQIEKMKVSIDVVVIDLFHPNIFTKSINSNPEYANDKTPLGQSFAVGESFVRFEGFQPKPTVWQGEHRITKENWWAKSNALNTALCLAKGEWFACVDDRSVLLPGWLNCIKEAMEGDYAVCGSYSKRVNLKVENGVITDPGMVIGVDPRKSRELIPTFGADWFGCNNALPLEWALTVGGYSEDCDGMRYEDTVFGNMLARNNFITKFDPRMMVVQDRKMPESEINLRGMDKGSSPDDKSHALMRRVDGKKNPTHDFNLNHVRSLVQAGQPFPHHNNLPSCDWYDGQPIKDFQ